MGFHWARGKKRRDGEDDDGSQQGKGKRKAKIEDVRLDEEDNGCQR